MDSVTGSSCHIYNRHDANYLFDLFLDSSHFLRAYIRVPSQADAFRGVMLMKDDYAKTRAIGIFDLTT